jgi:hypothetical protein
MHFGTCIGLCATSYVHNVHDFFRRVAFQKNGGAANPLCAQRAGAQHRDAVCATPSLMLNAAVRAVHPLELPPHHTTIPILLPPPPPSFEPRGRCK